MEEDIAVMYTQDGTIDLNGKPVLRSKTGRWKACTFLVGKPSLSHTHFYVHDFHYVLSNYFLQCQGSLLRIWRLGFVNEKRSVIK